MFQFARTRVYRGLISPCLWMAALIPSAYGQKANEVKAMEALLDSADYYELRNPERSLILSMEVLKRFPVEGHERGSIRALMNCANSEKLRGNIPEALAFCDRAILIAEKLQDPDLQIEVYYMKASVFSATDQDDSAIVYHRKVIELDHPNANQYFVCNAYVEIGQTYQDYGNAEQAEEYLLKGVNCSSDAEEVKPFTLLPLIKFYVNQNNPKYLVYLDTFVMTDFYRNASPQTRASHFDSFIHIDPTSASEKEMRGREICAHYLNQGSLSMHVNFALVLSAHLRSMGKLKSADSLLVLLADRARSTGRIEQEAQVFRNLYLNAKDQGRLKEAIDYNERYLGLYQQQIAEENRNAFSELNIKFETAQKDRQIELQNTKIEQEQRNRNFLIALSFLTSALLFLTFFYLRNRIRSARKITEQNKLIHAREKEHMVKEHEFAELATALKTRESERNRISQDLHDDVGASLSSIHIYSSVAEKAIRDNPQKAEEIVSQIKQNSRQVIENMSDIVWAMNAEQRDGESLVGRIKNYGYDLLSQKNIDCTYHIDPLVEKRLTKPEARKNVLLIVKEALNNIAKYSEAARAEVSISLEGDSMIIRITDNGKGFDPRTVNEGNGLGNMKERAGLLGGRFSLHSSLVDGTAILCSIPLAKISDR